MASETSRSPNALAPLFRFLVAYRIVVYLGGLTVIGVPLLLQRAFDVAVPSSARTALVTVSLALMVVTYLAERRVGYGHVDPQTGESKESYSLRLRLSVAVAVVGVAVGIYVALEVNFVAGLLFVAGAYLFGYLGYRGELDAEGDDGV